MFISFLVSSYLEKVGDSEDAKRARVGSAAGHAHQDTSVCPRFRFSFFLALRARHWLPRVSTGASEHDRTQSAPFLLHFATASNS